MAPANGAEAMRDVLARASQFDGVVAFNDAIALGAMRVLQEAGLRIPEDVAVIGFDDIDETQYSMPTLSTIDPGREEIARTADRAADPAHRGRRSERSLDAERGRFPVVARVRPASSASPRRV